ncbi:MAG: hypothetical protein OEZ68_04465 [Gammaproteobacteria bacterium]|nr:hypothetical protein [Gammaproteobacteria bacterium]MDH5800042.1 hypothetical protein [Gammaproteobacteria bacterium]
MVIQSIEKTSVLLLFAVGAIATAVVAEELDVDSSVSQRLMQKAAAMEKQRNSSDSTSVDYQTGFDDGYNQAIMDLVKSKLLNDPTVKPTMRRSLSGTTQKPQYIMPLRKDNRQVQTLVPDPRAIRSTPSMSRVKPLPPENMGATVSKSEESRPVMAPQSQAVVGGAGTQAASAAKSVISKPQAQAQQITQPLERSPLQPVLQPIQQLSAQKPMETPQATSADPALPWLEKSRGFLHKQQWPNAIDAASRAIVANAKNPDGFIYRSWARAENGDYHEAIEDASKAIQLEDKNPLAYNNRAYAYELAKSPELAVMDYEFSCKLGYEAACTTARKLKRVSEENKRKIQDFAAKALAAFQKGDWSDVEQFASRVLTIDSNNTDAYINRAVARTELGKYGKALKDCNTALIINPKLGVAYNNKGYIFELLGESGKAVHEYETACQLGIKQSCGDLQRLRKNL